MFVFDLSLDYVEEHDSFEFVLFMCSRGGPTLWTVTCFPKLYSREKQESDKQILQMIFSLLSRADIIFSNY